MSAGTMVVVELPAALCIAGLAALKADLDGPVSSGATIELDFGGVQRIDTAGLQFLLALVRSAGPRLRASGTCPALQALVDLYSLGGALAPLLDTREYGHA